MFGNQNATAGKKNPASRRASEHFDFLKSSCTPNIARHHSTQEPNGRGLDTAGK